ncbi:MAG: hypothetical protein BWK79_12490 [Beggiatoa sp. IS2]|nr:MAG: hypothetical protein BWK79_12490 [Beggiatoa sp. IS2]
MRFDARIKPTRKSTHSKRGVLLTLSVILLLGFAIYHASTFFNIKALMDKPVKGVVIKTISLPQADPLSKKVMFNF